MIENRITRSDPMALVVEAVKKNGDDVDWGLGRKLAFHAENVPLPTGRADLLLMADDNSILYVVQIVPGECSTGDVGRLLGHCGWLKKGIYPSTTIDDISAAGQAGSTSPSVHAGDVKGILLATGFGTGALCALDLCTELTPMTFSFSLRLEKV